MNTSNNSEPMNEPKIDALSIKTCDKIYQASWNSDAPSADETVETIKAEDYLHMCKQFLNRDVIITDKIIEGLLDYLEQNSKLKIHMPEGRSCCLFVLPCSVYGFPLEQQAIDNGDYVKFLLLDKDGMVEPGVFQNKNQVYLLLPEELRKHLTFTIDQYDNDDIYDITSKDRERIKSKVSEVFQNAKLFFNSDLSQLS
jgi:hypothetical protein